MVVTGKSARWLLAIGTMCLMGCVRPADSGLQVIVGAKLEPGPGRPPVDFSVVVISGGKFQAVGPQSSTPVPIGAQMTRGNGMTIQPIDNDDPIEPGRSANLVLKGHDRDRVMRGGNWVQ